MVVSRNAANAHVSRREICRCICRAHDGKKFKGIAKLVDKYTAVARCGSLRLWTRRLDDARLSPARPRVPCDDVVGDRTNGAGVRRLAPLAARISSRCCRRKYEGRRPLARRVHARIYR